MPEFVWWSEFGYQNLTRISAEQGVNKLESAMYSLIALSAAMTLALMALDPSMRHHAGAWHGVPMPVLGY